MAAIVVVLSCAACAEDEVNVRPILAIERTTNALTAGAVQSIHGTYTGCFGRSGSWSVRVSGSEPLPHETLSVVKNDSACTLALTELVADRTYVAVSPVALSASWQSAPAAFAASGSSVVAFHANAKLDRDGFGADFLLSVHVSDDVRTGVVGDRTATYATVQPSTHVNVAPAPDYGLRLTSGADALIVQTDEARVVVSAAGSAVLLDGIVAGQGYVVDLGALPSSPTYAQVDAAYKAGTERSISGANPKVPVSELGLVGQNLGSGVVRTILVVNTVLLVSSYEVLQITFRVP